MPPSKSIGWKAAALAVLSVALACELGLWFLQLSGQRVSLIWPSAGICVALIYFHGPRICPWLAVGHLWIGVRFGFNPAVALTPLLYVGEAWLAWLLSFKSRILQSADRVSIIRTLWQILPAPWLAAIPAAILMTLAATFSGRFGEDEFVMTTARVSAAHVHGMVALAPLFIHLFARDFQLLSPDDHWIGFAALTTAFVLMAMAFTNVFRDVMGMTSAAYLPFPMLMVAAVSLRPPVISLALALWCLASTTMTSMGMGPFGALRQVQPLELALYNLLVCYTTYLISVGTTRLIHQLERSQLTLEVAGVETWEWSHKSGFRSMRGEKLKSEIFHGMSKPPRTENLTRLAGSDAATKGQVPDEWKERLETSDAKELLLSTGKVTSRGRDGNALGAIGLLQDLSAVRKAEDALIALGHQRAILKSLQTRLNPHFLFNALNAIRALVYIDPNQASDAINTLSRLLRSNLRNVERPLIRLDEEIRLVSDLLSISSIRFGDRMSTRIEIPKSASSALVPPMAIYNLAENAIVHGIEKNAGNGTISISARIEGERLHVCITSPGQLGTKPSPGVGTKDVLQRFELLYAGMAEFELSQASENEVQARISLPFQDHESADC
ncbi:histidine kinase [Luteolibacter sp. GHJ8]|uniref:Histidine kinase n=1 Tax=Luteolibacter rhizosphaerae TaxID=2989719 RepID=A0ABT3G4T2_9BACT|nr:histidine kinase [Luteolibacter rhizosphaerae]MCW1914559.1 histidine kinase [Luteolibacter rhizosphaerae]